MTDIEDMLKARFSTGYIPVTESGCWIWEKSHCRGYGQFWNGKRLMYAHRFSYELKHGPIPCGLQIDHLCRVPACVNPDHLEAVTSAENTSRGTAWQNRRDRQIRMTHCKYGHPYDDENKYVNPRGQKNCRTCLRLASRQYKARIRLQ